METMQWKIYDIRSWPTTIDLTDILLLTPTVDT